MFKFRRVLETVETVRNANTNLIHRAEAAVRMREDPAIVRIGSDFGTNKTVEGVGRDCIALPLSLVHFKIV